MTTAGRRWFRRNGAVDPGAVAHSAPIALFVTDAGGRLRFANQRFTELTGLSSTGAADAALPVAAEDRPRVLADWVDARERRQPFRSLFRIDAADGTNRWIRIEAEPELTGTEVTGWTCVVVDAAEEIAAETRFEQVSEVLEATPDVVATIGLDGYLRYLNSAGHRLFGIRSEDEVRKLRFTDLCTPATHDIFTEEAVPTASEQGVWTGEVSLALPSGAELAVSQVLVAHRHRDGAVDYLSTIVRDLSERKAIEAQLLHAGMHDALTNLPNRALFIDRLAQALARAARTETLVAVLTLNIDRFKLVNDSFGHEAGDAVLLHVAGRLMESVTPGDTVARFGGDTLSVLREDVAGEEEATDLAARLAASLSTPVDVDGDRVFLSVSIGIALSDHPCTAETLMRDSDAAMHKAKEKGGGRHEVFVEDLRHSAVQRLRTANDLHRALAEQQFRLVYQPEVSLGTGHIVGVEALIRWHHPQRGLVPPAEFIPLAEETGLIDEIGRWVIEEAVSQAAAWREARYDGAALPVWLNLSPRQLGRPTLVDDVADALARYRVSPAQVGLEITESALFQDAEGAVTALGSLRSLGVRLAIDDFGTGYSSLSYLKRLPVDAVKVDRSFVDGLGSDEDDSAIVAAIVGMAAALRLTAIAEGVETDSQVRALQRIGCDQAQGYHFTTPQPPANVSRLLEGDRAGALFAFPALVDAPEMATARGLRTT